MDGRHIPGYYFDEAAQKYFRIVGSHVAPSGAKFTKEKVKRERQEDRKRRQVDRQEGQRQRQLIKRSPILKSPIVAGVSHNRATGLQTPAGSRDAVTKAYAQCLSTHGINLLPRRARDQGDVSLQAVDPGNSAVTPLVATQLQDHVQLYEVSYSDRTRQPVKAFSSMALDVYDKAQFIDSTKLGFRLCQYQRGRGLIAGSIAFENTSSAGDGSPSASQVISQIFLFPNKNFTSATFNRFIDTPVAIASHSHGLEHFAVEYGTSWGSSSVLESLDMCSAEWLGPTVAAGGRRDGRIYLWDSRSRGHTMRLRHDGVVTGIRRAGDESRFVVCGMVDKLVMYDLRMAPTGDIGGRETHQTLDLAHSQDGRSHTRKKSKRTRNSPRKHTTPPVLAFDYSNSYYSEQFGFDVCEMTNLVAAAGDTGGFSLYSLRTGQKIDGIPLVGERGAKPVDNPIKCLKFQKDPDCPPSLSVMDSCTLTVYS